MSGEGTPPGHGTAGEVFATFLKLGLTSFGGPVAHLGYFREALVTRRHWLSEESYADLVALCQFLPGPASSQVGFALGWMRAGWRGALAAFAAFTLPSALALVLFAMLAPSLHGPAAAGALHGLKLVAVAIVAQAVWGMAAALCPDRPRAGIALGAIALLAVLPGATGMMGAIAAGGLAGLALLPRAPGAGDGRHSALPMPGRGLAAAALALFLVLLIGLPWLAGLGQGLALADGFYRAGALVFGGGHVVLPLLDAEIVQTGWATRETFLAGYGAAQAVPGPLFTFSAYLGAAATPEPNGPVGAAIALAAIFLPGFLLLIGALPFWERLRRAPRARAAMQGANAAVVGILASALYSPVFTSAVTDVKSFALAAICFGLLTVWKAPPWSVVLLAALAGAGLHMAA